MFTGMQGFFGGLGGPGQGQGNASRAGKYDQFGRPIAPQTMSSDLGGATNFRGDDQPMGLRGGRYDQFGRPLAPGSGGQDSGPKRALLPAPGVVYPRSLRTQEPSPQGAARVTSAPVGPSKEAMIEHACRPIMKVDKTSSHYPWAEKEEPSQLMPPPLMPGFDPPGQSRGDQSDRDRRNRPGMRLDRPGLGFGESYDRGDPDKKRDVAGRSYDSTSSRARSPDRRSSDRKGRVDVRFEGRGLRDLYQDKDFGKGKDKPGDRRSDDRRSDDRRSDDRRSDDRRSDSRDGGRRRDDNRGRSNERRDRGRDQDDRDQKSGSRSRDDGGRSGGSWDGDRRDSSEEARRKERLEQQRNRQMQRSNSMQDIGQVDDFDSAWKKASAVPGRDQDLFGSTPSSAQSAWWTSCTICKMNFRYKEEFTAHVDEPLHYINLEKVRKEHAKEKAVKKVANVSQTASAVESIIYHCKICNISLNGWANFNQHVSSQIHLVHFIKNVGPKGDPKGLEYFEVSDRDAPEADGRNQNNAASLLSDWRRCKCCNMEIPSWEDPHVNCPNKGKINEMGLLEDQMTDDATGEPSDDSPSRERCGVLPEELYEKKKALGPAIFLFIRESLTRSNFPGLTHEVPAMVPSEVSALAAELISGAQKYPTVEPGNLIVGAVVNGVKLYMTRKKKKGWKCWTSDIRQVQDRLRVLVTFCGGQTTDLEDKFKAMLELAEPEEVSEETLALDSTQGEKSIDMFRNEDEDSRTTGSQTLITELKNTLTKLVNGHIQSTFSKIPCRVPPRVPKAVFTAAENLNAQDVKSGHKSGNAVTAAVINALKLKENFQKTIRGKLSAKNVHDMFDCLQTLVAKFGGDKTHLGAGTLFSRFLDLTHDAPTTDDTAVRKIVKEALRGPNALDPSDNLVSLKAKLVAAVADYIQNITTNVPDRIPPAVPPRMLGAVRALHSYIDQKNIAADDNIVYAVRDGMVQAYKPHLPRNFSIRHVMDLKESFGAMVTRFGGEAAKLEHRFDKLLELAKANEQKAAEENTVVPLMSLPLYQKEETLEDLQASYADMKKQLTNAVFIYVTDTLNSGERVPKAVSQRVQDAAERLNNIAVKLGTPLGFSVTSAVETALTDTMWQGVSGKISPVSVRAMNWSLGALVTRFGGNAESLTPRFEKLLELAEAKNKEIDEPEDTGGSTQYQDLKTTLKKLVLEHVRDTLIMSKGALSNLSSRVPLEIISAAKDLDTVAIKSGLPQGQCVTSAVQKALLETSRKGAYVLGRFSEASLQKLKQNLESLVAIFGGNADSLTSRFSKLLEMREEMSAENSGITTESQGPGLGCPQEDKLLFPDLKKHLTHRVLKHLRTILNNMSYTTFVPTMLPGECFEAATNLNDVAVRLNIRQGEDVTSAVSNALCEAIRRGFTGKFTQKDVEELKGSIDDFLSEFGGTPEALNPSFELLFKYAKEFSAASAEAKTSKEPPRFDELKLNLKRLVFHHVRAVLNGAPRKVSSASTLPSGIVSAAEELAAYAEQFGLNAGETVREAVFRAMKDIVKNQYGSGLTNLRGKYTAETVDQLKGCIEGLVTRLGGNVSTISTKFDILHKWINTEACKADATMQPPRQGMEIVHPPGLDLAWLSQNPGMSNPDAFHEDLPLGPDSKPQEQLRGQEFAEIQKSLRKILIAYFRAVVAGGDEHVTSEETKLEIFTAAKELDSYDIRCAGAPGAAVAVAIQHATRATSFKKASMKCIQGIKDSMISLVETLGGNFPARLAERFDSLMTVAQIREMESNQALGMLQKPSDSREVVDMDIAASDEENMNDVEADASTSKAEDTSEIKDPDVLPNDVFRKKMAVRVAVFKYLKDHLQGHDIPEKSSMVPENVYTAVTELYSSAVEKKVNPGTVVTGAIVAAVEFVIKRMANQSWKFTGAAVQDVKGRLDILVGSFGGDANDVAPVFDMVMKFAKDSPREATQSTREPSKEASEGKNEPAPNKSGQRSREKINFSLKKDEEEEKICTEPDAAFEGTKILPVFVVQKKTDFGIGVDKFCKQLLLSKDYSTGIDSRVPFAVSDFLKDLAVKLVQSVKKRAPGCDVGDVITSAMVAGVNTFCDGRSENWHFHSSAAVYDLKARLKNFLTVHEGYPAKLDEVFNKLLDFTENKGPDICEIEDLSYDEIVQLEGLLGLGESDMEGPTARARPEEHKLKMAVFTYLRNQVLNLKKKAILPNRAAEELASSCLKFGADVGLTITSNIVQGIRLFIDRVKEGWKTDISQKRTELKPHFACITEIVGKFNGNGFKVREQIRFLLDEIDGSAKSKWYIRKVERLQKIAAHPGFQEMKDKATERYKLHLRTQQHFDNTVSDLLREVIQEETNFIKKQAANGQEKNVEDIERNRKAFWETQMPLNHIRPSQGQMDDAYSNFLKEAGIDDDNRQGDSSNSQSSPHYREQRGGLQQQKSDQGRQQPGRRQDNRGPDGGSGYDYGHRQQTSPSSQQGGTNRFDQAQEAIGRPASSSSTGAGLSSQGQSVLNLFDKFLLQTGGEKLSNSQPQGQGQDNQASKLLDTIQQKLENIGDVEDDSAINTILDRVLDEYKALKSGGSQPISQAQVPASSMASGQAQSSLLPMPGGTMQVPGMQMQQQQLQGMQMQQQLNQLQGMQSMQTPMVRPLLMPTQPPVVSMMQSPPTRLMQPGQSNMQQQLMTSQPGLNQQGPGNSNQGQPNRNQQGQGNRNQGQPNRNQQGPGNQANRNQQGRFNRNQQGQSNRDGPGLDEQPGKMKAILAASLAATLAGKDKKQGMSETTQNKLSAVLRSLNERLEPSQRKRPSRWSSDDAGPKMQQDRHVSPERKRPRDRSPDRGRGGPNQGDRRPTRFDDRPDAKRDIPEPGRGNRGGPPINMQRKDEWMNEMKVMQMGGPNRGGGPRMPGAGGPRGAAPIKSLLPQPGGDMAKGPRMNMPGPGGPGRMDNAGPNVPIDRITALYGDIMNVLAPGSVNTPQEMGVATEMIASLSQAMACVLNNIYSPESQVKIQQSAQKFKLAFGNHPLVQAFFSATSVPPDVIQLLAKLDPMLLKRFVIVLQQARKDIQHQALQSAVFLEQFMVNSNLRM